MARALGLALFALLIAAPVTTWADERPAGPAYFQAEVAPLLQRRCLSCHNRRERKGDLSLESRADLLDSGYVEAGDPQGSHLLTAITSGDGQPPAMPKDSDPLTAEQVAVIRRWIAGGAKWPDDLILQPLAVADTDWWSLRPLERPAVPRLEEPRAGWPRNALDAFVSARHVEHGLAASPPADRRTLIRRLYFDLLGLPPTEDEVRRFVADPTPDAYERLVDRLLASPRYGERWGRHWLDVVHYADTHGFDKDKVRPNAWPYRDYVIRSWNGDKPYARFVEEQLAGDHFFPGTRDGAVALGFVAAGPFDFVGQIEVGNGTMEKRRVRNLDRDDMVTTTMNTFVSLTAQCARCHNHKFDPVTQEDYYRLQAVFAAVDRADRPFDNDPQVAGRRAELQRERDALDDGLRALHRQVRLQAGKELETLDAQLAALARRDGKTRPEFGYHSQISPTADAVKWVQLDLGRPTPIAQLVYVGCHDTFNNIGAGFGFPARYRIEIADDAGFQQNVRVVVEATQADVPNPGVTPQRAAVNGQRARYVRVTATRLAPRANDYIFALAELSVITPDGVNAALGAPVTALDSIEAPVRWSRVNLVDGYYYGAGKQDALGEIARLQQSRERLLARSVEPRLLGELNRAESRLAEVERELDALPAASPVYAAATQFSPQGNFRPTGGEPRPIYLLRRGDERQPDEQRGALAPGTVAALPGAEPHFRLPPNHPESERRAALARWIVDPGNPLTWRSIVNRVWHYHFGRGLVDTPNDFGRMGSQPTHPELLDWLALEFRDGGQSLKKLQRLICTSSTYRQSAQSTDRFARIDGGNRFLWRMNRRKLEAESLRDAVLAVAGKLRHEVGGQGFREFGFKDDHSPHYKYAEHDPDDPATHRRSVYRFIVRSVPDPFMTTLDCADPSLNVARRNETLTALQALALLNNKFMIRMAEHFAARVSATAGDDPATQIDLAFRLALARSPRPAERDALVTLAREHGLENACRVIFNLNEFVFVD